MTGFFWGASRIYAMIPPRIIPLPFARPLAWTDSEIRVSVDAAAAHWEGRSPGRPAPRSDAQQMALRAWVRSATGKSPLPRAPSIAMGKDGGNVLMLRQRPYIWAATVRRPSGLPRRCGAGYLCRPPPPMALSPLRSGSLRSVPLRLCGSPVTCRRLSRTPPPRLAQGPAAACPVRRHLGSPRVRPPLVPYATASAVPSNAPSAIQT